MTRHRCSLRSQMMPLFQGLNRYPHFFQSVKKLFYIKLNCELKSVQAGFHEPCFLTHGTGIPKIHRKWSDSHTSIAGCLRLWAPLQSEGSEGGRVCWGDRRLFSTVMLELGLYSTEFWRQYLRAQIMWVSVNCFGEVNTKQAHKRRKIKLKHQSHWRIE